MSLNGYCRPVVNGGLRFSEVDFHPGVLAKSLCVGGLEYLDSTLGQVLLDLITDLPDAGLVLTGAQRVPYAPGSDAGPNIRDAITTAAAPAARGAGAAPLRPRRRPRIPSAPRASASASPPRC